jgi:hypothetical protein
MNLFLRAKHWQLFLVGFVAPFVVQIVTMITLFSNLTQNNNILGVVPIFAFSFVAMMVLFMGTMLGWQWAVVTGLQKMLPPGLPVKLTKFKVFFFIPIVYILSIIILIPVIFFHADSINADQTVAPVAIGFAVIFPLHIFSMFCLFYCLYFVAKTFRTVELQRMVTFSDFAGEFFLIWFFPIGVWIIQPRINSLIEKYTGQAGDTVEIPPVV